MNINKWLGGTPSLLDTNNPARLDDYHEHMNEWSNQITPLIKTSLEEMLNTQYRSQRARELVMAIHGKRENSPRLREFLLLQSYLATRSKNGQSVEITQELLHLGAAVEIYNLSTYLINWALDEKGEAKTPKDIKTCYIEGMRLYDKAKSIIRELQINEDLRNKIIAELEQVNNLLYCGQGDDLYAISKDSVFPGGVINTDLEQQYYQNYDQACKRKCGYFLGWVARLGCYLAGADDKITTSMSNFGTALGTGIQIVNDCSDNLPLTGIASAERPYQDQFSDIENGVITLSTYELIKKEPRFLSYVGKNLHAPEKEEIFQAMLANNAFDQPMRITRKLRKSVCKGNLDDIFYSKKERKALSQMTAILDSSKVYIILRKEFNYRLNEVLKEISSNVNLYNPSIVEWYDRIMEAGYYDHNSVAEGLEKILGDRKKIMELGVGTGCLAEEMLKRGYEVSGIDFSDLMMKKAKERLGSNVKLFLQDITRLELPTQYEAMFSNGGVFFVTKDEKGKHFFESHLTTFEENQKAFQNIVRYLNKGGLLILGVQPTQKDLRMDMPDETEYSQEVKYDLPHIFKDYYVRQKNKVFAYQKCVFRRLKDNEIQRILNACGLKQVSLDDKFMVLKKS